MTLPDQMLIKVDFEDPAGEPIRVVELLSISRGDYGPEDHPLTLIDLAWDELAEANIYYTTRIALFTTDNRLIAARS